MIYADVTIFASGSFLVFTLAWAAEVLGELV